MPIAALTEEGAVADGQVVTLAGILSGVQRRITKQGRAWASATLEDLGGAVEVLFFPNTYELVGQYIAEDAIVVVKGRVDRRDDQPAADGDGPVDAGHHRTRRRSSRWCSPCRPSRCTPPLVERLKEVLASHPGTAEVHLQAGQRRAGPRCCGWARCGSRRRPR